MTDHRQATPGSKHWIRPRLIPEELVPLKVIGRMVLDRWPNNFFAETEQVAYCPGNIVPGIDFSNDPLLQGRLFSYIDTQLIRLGGPNFHQIPINAPSARDQTRPKPRRSIVVRSGMATSGPMRRTPIPQGDHVDLVASLGKGLGAAHDPIVALIEGTGEHEA